MLLVKDIRLPLSATEHDAIEKALKLLRVSKANVLSAGVAKISVDARRRPISIVYTIAVSLRKVGAELSYESFAPCVSLSQKKELTINNGTALLSSRPIVCGFGPSGIFAALVLARQGFAPIVLEQGASLDERVATVERFWETGELSTTTNVQFGEGGAGTFSDGKLTTRINDPLCSFVTDVLLAHGAPQEIAIKHKPHIGTDLLRDVIRSVREEIISLGGEVRFNCKLTGLIKAGDKLTAIKTSQGDIPCEALVLAIGHSSRDTFAMLPQSGIELTAKPFSVGFRAEHLQSDIDNALYGEAAGNPALAQGEYQLSAHVGSRCVYTFCMCPGGVIIPAASEEGRVVTNGMSYHKRDGENANAAIVVSVTPEDFDNSAEKAIEFQRSLEQAAYVAGGSGYKAPAQSIKGFLNDSAHISSSGAQSTYSLGVTPYNLSTLLPQELSAAIKSGLAIFDRRMKGFASDNAILTGIETRTSSPVRIKRSDAFESVDINGVFPCGEGAGYAGGIMSAAVDGVRIASAIAQKYKPK